MAINAAAIWRVRTGGDDANGGFFVPGSGGVDYSQQDAAELTVSDAVTDGSTTLTSATGGFTSAMVGNGICIAGTTVREIASVTDTNTIVLDATVTAGTGQTAKVGGAKASVGPCLAAATPGNVIRMASGPYTTINSTANASGGRWNFGTARVLVSGDADNRPTITVSGITGQNLITLAATGTAIENLIIDVAETDNTAIRAAGNGWSARNIEIRRGRRGIEIAALGQMAYVTYVQPKRGVGAHNAFLVTAGGVVAYRCGGESNDGTMWHVPGGATLIECVGLRNGNNMGVSDNGTFGMGCMILRCAFHGLRVSVRSASYIADTIVYDEIFNVNDHAVMVRCASNNAPTLGGYATSTDFVTLTNDPFVDAANGNFALTAEAKALLSNQQSAGPWATDDSYATIGAWQGRAGGGLPLGEVLA